MSFYKKISMGLLILSLSLNAFIACNLVNPSDENDDTLTSLLALTSLNARAAYTVNFQALGSSGSSFSCGENFHVHMSNPNHAYFTPVDLRFYISEISLLDASGNEVAITLDSDTWQSSGVAYLDFENGNCTGTTGGTTDTNTSIRFTAPVGVYSGIKFTLGLPYSINSLSNSTASSPLNLPVMHWSWLSGYKFMRFEFLDTESTAFKTNFHLGSTNCGGDISSNTCSSPFRRSHSVTSTEGFVPGSDTVKLDLATLLMGYEKDVTAARSCMPYATGDAFCEGILSKLGLTTTGTESSSTPAVFSIVKAQ